MHATAAFASLPSHPLHSIFTTCPLPPQLGDALAELGGEGLNMGDEHE